MIYATLGVGEALGVGEEVVEVIRPLIFDF